VDLGEEWTHLTGLPFVWAFWAGRPGVLASEHLEALTVARDHGVEASAEIAAAYCGPDHAARGQAYLRENISYQLGEREEAGLRAYYELAEAHGAVDRAAAPAFYR